MGFEDIDYDPTLSYTKEQLLAIEAPPGPEDFEAFWRGSYAQVMACRPDYRIEKELWSPNPGVNIIQTRFKNFDGVEIGMWLARPEQSAGGLLIGQGYGHPVLPPTTTSPGLTVAMPCIRGLGISTCRDIPWEIPKHAVHGMESPETFVIRGAVADLWMGASVMLDMFPDVAENLNYQGGSLGGAMGMLMLPWDARFRAGEINVPTLGGKIQLDCQPKPGGGGEARRNYALNNPGGMRSILYCDAAAAARFIRIPLLITPALSDHSNPPPAQFAIANAVPEAHRILRIREVGHRPPTEQDKLLEQELNGIRKQLFRM